MPGNGRFPSLVNEFVCRNIRRLRTERGISVLEAARRTGIPASSYSCLEHGRYKLNLDNLFRILQAFHSSISDVWPTADLREPLPVDEEYIRRVLLESSRLLPIEISGELVVEVVCDHFGFERIDREVSRSSKPVRLAQVYAAVLISELPQVSLTRLSELLDVNISSLSHRRRRLLEKAEDDPELRRDIEETTKKLREELMRRTGRCPE